MMMMIMKNKFAIKEIFYSLQGEGFYSGRPAIFIRFTGCNFWSGLEKHRKNAICDFCDTDFRGVDGQNGGFFNPKELIDKIKSLSIDCKFVVLTGGEPLLQVTKELINYFHSHDYYVALETNGSKEPHDNIDWICVSPKNPDYIHKCYESKVVGELKVVYPTSFSPHIYRTKIRSTYSYIQPLDTKKIDLNEKYISKAMEYCKKYPKWFLSLQTHKILNID